MTSTRGENMFKTLLALIQLTLAQAVLATSTVAILDNQIDYTHFKLADHLWANKNEVLNEIDDDNNGFVDDINGWSFIDNSNKLFNFSDYGKFPSEVYRYYEIRAKKYLGTITDEEKDWYNTIRKDEEFKVLRKKFSKFAHGTHVACLAVNSDILPASVESKDLKFIPIRYLGETKTGAFSKPEFKPLTKGDDAQKVEHIRKYINSYIVWMLGKFEVAISYSKDKAQVIHASWGQGYGTTQKVVNRIFEEQFKESDQHTDLKKVITDAFIEDLIKRGTALLRKHRDTLFVFSAGNKKEDTDTELHYPSSILLSNVISVGASDKDNEKASFSNFGQNTVSVFAQGIAIESCTPENRKLPINGTSQAAPQVSGLALKLNSLLSNLEINSTPSLLKALVTETVDKVESLSKLSAAGGVINQLRAFSAAKKLKTMSLKEAIAQSYIEIPNP